MAEAESLSKHCFISSGAEGDSFVGVRSDGDSISIFFPVGYTKPANEADLRRDVMNLIIVLTKFSGLRDLNFISRQIKTHETVNFPIQAYIGILSQYRDANYNLYTEREVRYERGRSGKVSFERTIKTEKPIWSNGSPVYLELITRKNVSDQETLLTLVHEYCVYESNEKVGFLFPGTNPPKPRLQFDHDMFKSIVLDKKSTTNDDRVGALLDDMLSVIDYLGDRNGIKQFYFGTERFEYVWENMIDFTFGESNKEDYFPRTSWILKEDSSRNSALEPDTIMIAGNKVFVLDAKYYRFGNTRNIKHLPQSSSINKQITYGEYIASMDGMKDASGNPIPVYNAFLMPYSMYDKRFSGGGSGKKYLHIGEAVSDWKTGDNEFEHVQGIMVDIRALMLNVVRHSDPEIKAMAELIENATAASLAGA